MQLEHLPISHIKQQCECFAHIKEWMTLKLET
jgi:hypothetical protein